MRYTWVILLLAGIWFLASAATERGLLPSGHGFGRISEIVLGLMLIAFGIYRYRSRA
jgi:threonine/homoserine/homoserine lactone efflux protein